MSSRVVQRSRREAHLLSYLQKLHIFLFYIRQLPPLRARTGCCRIILSDAPKGGRKEQHNGVGQDIAGDLARLEDEVRSRRHSSFDRTGGNADQLAGPCWRDCHTRRDGRARVRTPHLNDDAQDDHNLRRLDQHCLLGPNRAGHTAARGSTVPGADAVRLRRAGVEARPGQARAAAIRIQNCRDYEILGELTCEPSTCTSTSPGRRVWPR